MVIFGFIKMRSLLPASLLACTLASLLRASYGNTGPLLERSFTLFTKYVEKQEIWEMYDSLRSCLLDKAGVDGIASDYAGLGDFHISLTSSLIGLQRARTICAWVGYLRTPEQQHA